MSENVDIPGWVSCRAKRLECAELPPALARLRPFKSASKLDALSKRFALLGRGLASLR
jgi:hypothetical protein